MTSAANAAHGESAGSAMRGNNKQERRRSRGILLAAGLAGIAALLGGPALAQEGTVVVGGSGAPDVQVDLGAVDGGYYGAGPGGRRLLMPNSKLPQTGPVILKPPGAMGAGALKPPSLKAPKKQAAMPAATEPEMAAPPAPKMAAEPPPPPAKKVAPVEGAPLPAPQGTAKGEPAPPPPPPEPPSAPAAKTNGATPPAAKGAAPAAAAVEPPPPPPPPPPGAKAGNGQTTEAAAPPPPPPAAKPANGQAAAVPPPPQPPAAEGAAPAPPAAEQHPAEVVALPPPSQPVAIDKATAIAFAVGSTALADQAKQMLAEVAQTLNGNAELRLQIVAYASGNDDNASQARRLSLSRALAVRSYLIDNGVRSTRMDVRALGNKFDTGPGDRVDLIVVKP